MKNKIKNAILIICYFVLGIAPLFIPNTVIAMINILIFNALIYLRIDITYALKPIDDIFHAWGMKYKFQKKGQLEKYKKIKQVEEIILVSLAVVLFALGIILKQI